VEAILGCSMLIVSVIEMACYFASSTAELFQSFAWKHFFHYSTPIAANEVNNI